MNGCRNPDHKAEPQDACQGCYLACEAELTALNDRYTRLLAESSELRRKVREAEDRGDVIPLPGTHLTMQRLSPAGFEALRNTDAIQVSPRTRPAREDVLTLRVFHRTTGGGRSILLTRQGADALHKWLGWWLDHGWPGVPRRCGLSHRPDSLHEWLCDQPPGHAPDDHEGPAIGWATSDPGKPGRNSWPVNPESDDIPSVR